MNFLFRFLILYRIDYFLTLFYFLSFLSSAKMNDNADDNLPLQMKGDAWFGSVKSAVNLAQRGCMEYLM